MGVNFSSLALMAVFLAGLVLVGCTLPSSVPTPAPSATLAPSGSGPSGSVASATASVAPSASLAPSGSDTGSSAASATPAAQGGYVDDSTSQDLDSASSDLDELDSLSGDLSAGDVEYSDEGG
ncbi:hypothetical protein HYV43_03390 [Candidatus Micrarchaeota archaeon]|nr:hypothetical protein [Candidatus Micrarchaeota archaeon]